MTISTSKNDNRSPSQGTITSAGLTDVGKARDHNEDAFLIDEDQGLFIVSDGMGGHESGEVASSMVVKVLPLELAVFLGDGSPSDDSHIAGALHRAMRDLSVRIYEHASQTDAVRGMGATVVACVIKQGVAIIAHMGDSRAYLMRAGVLERLTEDHALVEMLLRLGQINKKEAKDHPARHALTRYIGMENDVGPDVDLLELQDGDRILLCSDGLTNMVKDRTIARVLWKETDLQKACEDLVKMANDAGGEDNITAVVLQYGDWENRPNKGKEKVAVRRAIGHSTRKPENIQNKELEKEDEAIEENI